MKNFKYDEKKNIDDVIDYINGTYKQHYVGGDVNGTQIQDLLNSIGVAEHFCQGNAMKYVSRYGRKKGKNKLDLYKAIHYILLLMYFSELNGDNDNED